MKEVCPYCLGSGLLTKHSHIVYDLEEWVKKFKKTSSEKRLILKCHPLFAARLREGKDGSIFKLQLKYFVRIKIEEDSNMQIGHLKFISAKTGSELTEIFN